MYLIYKELLHNVLRHAGAENIPIHFKATAASIQLTVQDDGCGLDVLADQSGHGLLSLQERAKSLNAHLTIVSTAAQGTLASITCSLYESPLRKFWPMVASDSCYVRHYPDSL